MSGEDDHNPFGGQNKASAILVTLVISSFAVSTLYIAYRQLNRVLGGRGAPDPRLITFAPTVDLGQRPILWDVYIEKEVEVEWRMCKVSESSLTHLCVIGGLAPRVQCPNEHLWILLPRTIASVCSQHCIRYPTYAPAEPLTGVLERGGDSARECNRRPSVPKKAGTGLRARGRGGGLGYWNHRSTV